MKTLTLSDHTGDQLQAAAAKREAAYQLAVLDYRNELIKAETRREANRQVLRQAWRRFSPLGILGGLFRVAANLFIGDPEPPVRPAASQADHAWSSGREGEQRVAQWFGGFLDNRWILIAGYKNRKGEIDQVLVGPGGLYAIEIKSVNGLVHCDGDRWWRDKYDRYDNLVESGVPIADRGGRGPSLQLNEPTDNLQTFLGKRSVSRRIRRFIIFAHDRSKLGRLLNLNVHGAGTLCAALRTLMFEHGEAPLTDAEVTKLIELIAKDHAYHAQPPKRAAAAATSA